MLSPSATRLSWWVICGTLSHQYEAYSYPKRYTCVVQLVMYWDNTRRDPYSLYYLAEGARFSFIRANFRHGTFWSKVVCETIAHQDDSLSSTSE